MKLFMDFEFVERGPQLPIQPISGGFVTEDGRELYVINEECLSSALRHPWVSLNVVPTLPITMDSGGANMIIQWDRNHPDYDNVLALDVLVQRVHNFLLSVPDLELWGDFVAYDHVVLCQLFGAMADLPPGIPMWSHEIRQLAELYPNVALPSDPPVAHHALYDARWNREAYDKLVASGYAVGVS